MVCFLALIAFMVKSAVVAIATLPFIEPPADCLTSFPAKIRVIYVVSLTMLLLEIQTPPLLIYYPPISPRVEIHHLPELHIIHINIVSDVGRCSCFNIEYIPKYFTCMMRILFHIDGSIDFKGLLPALNISYP